jgi:serine/threonine protein kinase
MIEKIGRYEILEEIGQGGFAIVYRARDIELGRFVAMKELRPILLQDTAWIRRFMREAQTVAGLDHPHIVTIYDVYREQNRLFIVMHLVNGASLEDRIAQKKGLSWAKTMKYITTIAQGLDYAHAQGILHRDLKPANILIDKQRGAMLSDFGLAKMTSQNSMSMSASGTVVGTPHYIAPEIWESDQFTPQADIYALGCILFEMITGTRAFKGESPPSVMMAHFKPPSLPSVWPDDVPAGITNIFLKALAHQPTDRYETAGEMIESLVSLEGGITKEPEISEEFVTVQSSTSQSSPESPVELMISHQQLQERVMQLEKTLETSKGMIETPLEFSSAIPSSPEVIPRREKKWLWGCGCTSITIMVFMMLIVFGIGHICSATERIVATIFPNVVVGEIVTEDITIQLPDEKLLNVEIDFASGDLSILPDASEENVVEGVARFNVPELKPLILSDRENIRLYQEGDVGLTGFLSNDIENAWDIKLSDTPMKLSIEADHANGNFELGGLSLVNLDIEFGLADFDVSFSKSNQIPMEMLEINGGGTNATLYGLANSRAKKLIFNGGASNYLYDFSGDLQDDMDVVLRGEFSRITIVVPEGMAAEIHVNPNNIDITTNDLWQKRDMSEYFLPSEGEGKKITIGVEIKSGNLRLRNKQVH